MKLTDGGVSVNASSEETGNKKKVGEPQGEEMVSPRDADEDKNKGNNNYNNKGEEVGDEPQSDSYEQIENC